MFFGGSGLTEIWKSRYLLGDGIGQCLDRVMSCVSLCICQIYIGVLLSEHFTAYWGCTVCGVYTSIKNSWTNIKGSLLTKNWIIWIERVINSTVWNYI